MEIEKNVRIPLSGRGRPKKYDFSDMDVGDSVLIRGEDTSGRAYLAANQYGRRTGKKFTGRSMDGGVRIWRVA